MFTVNLNDTVKVKLTDLGKIIFYRQYDNLNQRAGRVICEPKLPDVDEEGYTSFQLWDFIQLYGGYIGMGRKNVIEPLDIICPMHGHGDPPGKPGPRGVASKYLDRDVVERTIADVINRGGTMGEILTEVHHLDGADTKWTKELNSGPKWRNASDEEPTFGEDVIVWIHDVTGDTPFDYTSVGWLTSHRDWIVDNEECKQVVAWQPKPKPGDED